MESDLNIDNILTKERANSELAQLDNDFYSKASKLIHEIEEEKNKTDIDSPKYVFIEDQLENAKKRLRDVLQTRMTKIVKEASSQTAEKKRHEIASLTQEERELYNALLDILTVWKRKRLDQVLGIKKEIRRQDVHKDLKDYILVRLLRDIPTFVGADERNYTLAKEDVATLPAMNAQALIVKKAAVQIMMK